MKKIEVIVRDKNTLVLEEDAKKGDYIDLTSIANVDFTQIESAILEGKDTVYKEKLKEYVDKINLINQQELQKKEADIEQLRASYEHRLKSELQEKDHKHELAMNTVQNQLEALKKQLSTDVSQAKKEAEEGYVSEIQKLTLDIERLRVEYEHRLKSELQEKDHKHELTMNTIQSQLTALKRQLSTDVSQAKKEAEEKYASEIQKLTSDLERQKIQAEAQSKEMEMSHQLKVQELEQNLESLQASVEDKLKAERLATEKSYSERIAKLDQDILVLNKDKESLELNQKLELERKLNEKNEEHSKELQQLKAQIDTLTELNHQLQRQKASLNVKQTGEDLEVWCDNEVKSYMQNGLEHCSWEKDNQVVRYEDESKGSKADYIFTIFASKTKDVTLAKVCLDMKDENPDSVNRKKNADYYKALDTNRKKKECKYAVLVSNLELDKPNDIPIYKVIDYEDMYVVRPAYLMTFLNMLVSLTTRFKDLLLTKEKESLELKSKIELEAEFESLKKTYLDKPLESLEKNIDEIIKQNENISKASKKIEDLCDTIKRSYLNEIMNKLERFEIKINRAMK